MTRSFFFASLCAFLVTAASTGVEISVQPLDATAQVRAYDVNYGGSYLTAVGAAFDVDAGAQTADLNAVAFACQTPNNGDNVGFYFGVLEGTGSYSVSGSDVLTSYSGSLSEIAAGFLSVFPYLDKDGNPGFQYTPEEDHWTCLVDNVDCIPDYQTDALILDSLTWNNIVVANTSCASSTNAVASNPCIVYTLTLSDVNDYVRFDMHITTQPIDLGADAVPLTPNGAKLDVTINYPWNTASSQCGSGGANCKVGIIALSGGKVTTANGGAVWTVTEGATQRTSYLTVEGGWATYFDWAPTAQISGSSSTVYYSELNGTTVNSVHDQCSTDLTYAGTHLVSCAVNSIWLAFYNGYSAVGWETRLHFFSWDETAPVSVYWDPSIGGVDCGSDATNPVCTGAGSGSASLLFTALAFMLA